ncbi:MAG TPA: cytochrome c/FTR1 family iron permease [Gemmatimonadales bacterium]|nr:cytochrome c/FTR1 family iron permease [Gemmatimonadales bacterium]
MLIRRSLVVLLLTVTALPSWGAGQATDTLAVARRVVAATSLAAKEYALGVAEGGGRITQVEEVEEARLFIRNAREDVPHLPAAVRAAADSQLAAIAVLITALAPPADVERQADALTRAIAAAVGGAVDPTPRRRPSVARGRAVFAERCQPCHGDRGKGDGPQAEHMVGPRPADLGDPAVMGDATLTDVYRRVSIGIPGTAMPAYEGELSEEDRWAVANFVMTLQFQGSATAATFAAVRRQVDSAVAHRSDREAFEAYLTFEQVEADLRVRDGTLARSLEAEFATLRVRVAVADPTELDSLRGRLLAGLERAERMVSDRPSQTSLFAQSFLLLLREGFEAILILAALLTFLTKAGADDRRRDVTSGALWAVAASVATWVLVEWLFKISTAQREALEGATMLLAMAVLFWVSYWLLSKIDVARWTAFVKGRMDSALAGGSGLALASVAFLAVYREGLETILFYQALFASADGRIVPVAAGMVVGGAALAVLYVAINRFGLRIPMRPFFAVTSAVLYYMAFVFAGKGVAELQEAGVVGISPVGWAPRVPALGIYPTIESLALQGVLIAAAVVAVLWALRPVPAGERA